MSLFFLYRAFSLTSTQDYCSKSSTRIRFFYIAKKRCENISVFTSLKIIGVTRFELAASTSLRWRSSQTEPHPDLVVSAALSRGAIFIIPQPHIYVKHFFIIFQKFFHQRNFNGIYYKKKGAGHARQSVKTTFFAIMGSGTDRKAPAFRISNIILSFIISRSYQLILANPRFVYYYSTLV